MQFYETRVKVYGAVRFAVPIVGYYDQSVHDSAEILNGLQGLLHPPSSFESKRLRYYTCADRKRNRDGDNLQQVRSFAECVALLQVIHFHFLESRNEKIGQDFHLQLASGSVTVLQCKRSE